MSIVIRGLCLVIVWTPFFAFAQVGSGAAPCRADVQKYCAQSAGGGRTEECLIDHQKEISDGCYNALKARLSNQRGLESCKADVSQFCKGIKPGGGRIVNCLVDHQKEISDGCYGALKEQKSGTASDGAPSAGGAPPTAPGPIYRSKQADGRTLYSDTLPLQK